MTETTAPRRRWRGPKTHKIAWAVERPVDARADSPWTCSCGKVGDGTNLPAQQHLTTASASAFKRLEDHQAYAILTVSAHGDDRFALEILFMHPAWPQLRRYVATGYDHVGHLAAGLRWNDVAAALDAGDITGEDEDLLVLRFAASVVGACSVNVGRLSRITFDQHRNRRIRSALDAIFPPAEECE
ncbi:hypothetical protein JNW90_01255 [Micromonospora sp. STR1s_5]|nr:hypothetical protein [Micromonospora sp. STR1s_5]